MEKILTIIVPSYNTQAHIDTCLPTIIDKECIDDIEILLINDGSTDGTGQILEKYAQKYPNSIKVINKENGGHGSVINRGIREAQGKYFRVIDGDDPVLTDNLNKLVRELRDTDADIVYTPFYTEYVGSGRRRLGCRHGLKEGVTYQFDEICDKIGCLPLHAINYKTAILKDNHIKLQERCYYEDTEYNLYPIPYINSLVYYNIPVYIYRIGIAGQSISVEKTIKNQKMLEIIVHNLCLFYEDVITWGISVEKRKYLSNAICSVIKNMYGIYLKMPYGKTSRNRMKKFSDTCKQWSLNLYNEGNTGVIRLLRKDSRFVYFTAYVGFGILRKKRGF